MKRITAILFALIFVLSTPVISFADDIYIIEDEEDNYIPEVPTTTKPAETTTSSTCTIPSFNGKKYLDYYNALIAEGFDNIDVIDMPSDTVPEGQVISVSADKSTYPREEAANALIRVYVSTGPEES